MSTATEALLMEMDIRQARPLVCITGVGASDSRGHVGFFEVLRRGSRERRAFLRIARLQERRRRSD